MPADLVVRDQLLTDVLELTGQIMSAYCSNNQIGASELPALIEEVHAVLAGLVARDIAPTPMTLVPAVPIKRSVFPDYIVCLEDGKKLKMLKRHLQSSYDLTPQQYRERWGLPAEYPMVAPNYAARRSSLAKEIGLGRKPGADTAA